jgi:hypothetical protein
MAVAIGGGKVFSPQRARSRLRNHYTIVGWIEALRNPTSIKSIPKERVRRTRYLKQRAKQVSVEKNELKRMIFGRGIEL